MEPRIQIWDRRSRHTANAQPPSPPKPYPPQPSGGDLFDLRLVPPRERFDEPAAGIRKNVGYQRIQLPASIRMIAPVMTKHILRFVKLVGFVSSALCALVGISRCD